MRRTDFENAVSPPSTVKYAGSRPVVSGEEDQKATRRASASEDLGRRVATVSQSVSSHAPIRDNVV